MHTKKQKILPTNDANKQGRMTKQFFASIRVINGQASMDSCSFVVRAGPNLQHCLADEFLE
jgi:hypothetical protein